MRVPRRLGLVFAVACLSVALAPDDGPQEERLTPQQVRAEFERRYHAWRESLRQMRVEEYLAHGDPLLTKATARPYWQMMELGLPALPYIMQKMEAGDWWLARGVYVIAKRRFHRSEYSNPADYGDAHTKADMLLAWWQRGEEGPQRRFQQLYAKWRQVKTPGGTVLWTAETLLYDHRGELTSPRARMEFTEAGEVYDAIQCLGIAALPHIVKTLQQGHADLLAIAVKLTDGAGGLGEPTRPPEIQEFLRWWEANKQRYAIPWPDEEAAP